MSVDDSLARQRAIFPQSAAGILSRRTLKAHYPALAAALRPGMAVLDVGCGTGAMTLGMAQAVFPAWVVGIDSNAGLLAQAQRLAAGQPNLSFQQADLYALPFAGEFEVVVAARVLQWLAEPQRAVRELARALHPGGQLYLLDYHHEQAHLEPPPPPSMLHFRQQYLAWRREAGLFNDAADHLADWLTQAGLSDAESVAQLETVRRGDPDFEQRIQLWGEVAASRGHQVVAAGYLSEVERRQAEEEFYHWTQTQAQSQTFVLRSASARKVVISLL